MNAWNRYWFSDAAYVNLAVLRIAACFVLLFHTAIFHHYASDLAERFAYDDSLYQPVVLLKLIHAPFGLITGADIGGLRPPDGVVMAVFALMVVGGLLGLVGLMSRISIAVAAAAFCYIQGFIYSFKDFHHPEAILAIGLTVLALSPSGHVLSVDNWLRSRRGLPHRDLLDESPHAGWPLVLMQWFIALMYLSAVYAKLDRGGFDWMNGYTLQFYLAQDGLRWGGDLAIWLSQYHILIMLMQVGVVLFQATFFLEVIFPPLRWLYVPAGLTMHTMIYILLGAPFFVWIAFYVVFIPWDAIVARLREGRIRSVGSQA